MDQIKPSAAAAVRRLQAAGIETVLLTGDNTRTATTRRRGKPATEAYCALTTPDASTSAPPRATTRSTERRVKDAHFRDLKPLSAFDWSFNPKLPQEQLRDLATGSYLVRKEHILLCGPAGVGKTHLAEGLGHQAARQGFRVESAALAEGAGIEGGRMTFASVLRAILARVPSARASQRTARARAVERGRRRYHCRGRAARRRPRPSHGAPPRRPVRAGRLPRPNRTAQVRRTPRSPRAAAPPPRDRRASGRSGTPAASRRCKQVGARSCVVGQIFGFVIAALVAAVAVRRL